MTSAREAAFKVLFAHLVQASPLWEGRVQPQAVASAGLQRPYVLFFMASGGRAPSVPSRHKETVVVSVKGVANEMATALAIEAEITALLHNSGTQDIDPRLPSHPEWDILTVSEDRAIDLHEKFAGAQDIYHAGHQYRLLMERRA